MRERYSYSYFCLSHEIHSPLRILQLCKKFPYPLKDGESVAVSALTNEFSKSGCKVTVVAINTQKHFFNPEKLPVTVKQQADYHAVEVNTSVTPYNALLNLFSSRSYNIERFDSARFRNYLVKLLQEREFDVVLLETLYLVPYLKDIRENSKAKVVLRSHNLEYEIWEHLASTEKNRLKKKYLLLLASRLKKYELENLNSYDAIVPISPADEKKYRQLGCKIPLHTTVTGIEVKESETEITVQKGIALYFLGSMDWMPNRQGVIWFVENVWRRLSVRHPEITFHLAGRNFPKELNELQNENMKVAGEVKDVMQFISDKHILLVPLFSGSGMRIKIIEAMSFGKTVVSTTLGAEGIEYTNGKNILIADSADEFSRVLETCLTNPDLLRTTGTEAKKLVREKYSPQQSAKDLLAFLSSLIT